jgi:hypothetical protein
MKVPTDQGRGVRFRSRFPLVPGYIRSWLARPVTWDTRHSRGRGARRPRRPFPGSAGAFAVPGFLATAVRAACLRR